MGWSYTFLSCDESETVKVRNIISRLENPLTKPLLRFLSFILPSVDRFNRLFRKSTENTTSQQIGSNFLTTDQILEANENLRLFDFVQENQVSNEELGIGNETWISVVNSNLPMTQHFSSKQWEGFTLTQQIPFWWHTDERFERDSARKNLIVPFYQDLTL